MSYNYTRNEIDSSNWNDNENPPYTGWIQIPNDDRYGVYALESRLDERDYGWQLNEAALGRVTTEWNS